MGNKQRIFLDSSVIISALFSEKGASHFILHEPIDFELQINEFTFREIYNVIKNKYGAKEKTLLNQLFHLLADAHVCFVPNPDRNDLGKLQNRISTNDAPILASALLHSDYLITLDNEFFSEKIKEVADLKELTILKPGIFLERYKLNWGE